jgi:hypothetical protein
MTAGNAAAAAAKPVKTATPLTNIGGSWARAYVPKKIDALTPAPEPVEENTRSAIITIRDAREGTGVQ